MQKLAEGDKKAGDILIKHNLRLVVYIAKKYRSYPDSDELISVGTMGLMKAINSYSPDKGCQLATYASRCIENEMLMVLRGAKKAKNTSSLYESIGKDKDGNELTIMDTLSVGEECVYDALENSLVKDALGKILKSTLTKKELLIVVKRYGLNGFPRMTQQEIADELKISRSYVSRLEKAILQKLKSKITKEDLYI